MILICWWLIDPSAYGGHREVDLVHALLFGGSYAGAAERIALRYAG